MTKILYILLLFGFFLTNESPEWSQIPNQFIDEDCGPDNCNNFPIDLNDFLTDSDDDDLTITFTPVNNLNITISDDLVLDIQPDADYFTTSPNQIFLETDLCLPAVDETSPRSCGFTPNLEEFTVVLSSRAQNFSGMVEPDWNFPPDDLPQDILDALSTFKIEMSKKFGGVEAVIRWWCEADRVIYEFSDDVFYLGDRGGSLDCSLERNSYNQIINCFVGGARNISNIAYLEIYDII